MPIGMVGLESLVNTTTLNSQELSSVATLQDGRFVVTWTDSSAIGADTSNKAIRARIFNPDGTQSVAEFVANSDPTNIQVDSAVTVLSDGRFLITWDDYSQSDSDIFANAVRGRVFNPDGTEAVAQFRVNTTITEAQGDSSVAALPNGKFIVTWTDQSETGADQTGQSVRARVFNADGSEAVPEFVVNTTTAANQRESSVVVLTNGNILVTFTDTSQTGDDTTFDAVRARIFNSSGAEVVPEFLVNTSTASAEFESKALALPDGRFMVTWRGADTSGYAVQARIFNADGSESVPEFNVHSTVTGDQFQSAITVLADGRLLVTWTDSSGVSTDTDPNAIRGRILNLDGTEAIPEFDINTTVAGNQSNSAVTALLDGKFVVTWRDGSATGGDTSSFAIRSQIFDPLVFNGTSAADNVTGGSLADRYFGNGGIDHLSGRGGADYLNGGAEGDTLDGGDGSDQLWGGLGADQHIGGNDTGIDFARYDDANYGNLTLRLDGGSNVGAAALGDTYVGIEGLVGGLGADIVVGNSSGNYLYGGDAADFVYGLAGADFLSGDAGGDNLWGGLGADQHIGGNDAGLDFARYDDTNYGNLTIRLDNPSLNAGAAAVGDTYSGIEGLVGGLGSDTVVGNNSANYLFGGGATDNLYGLNGDDYLSGDAGGDNLWGGLGADQHIGGNDAGVDFARYDDANYGNLTIRLDSPASNAGAAALGDTYTGIEGLVAGLGADVVLGNASANYLYGVGGSDFIDGLGGSDYLNGGAAADRFRFSTALGADNVDTIADFVHLTDDMLLSKSLFAAVGATLTADELRIGMAQDANDFILYNNGTGALYYDSNANAAGGIVQFATVTAGTVLSFDDFVMV